MIHTIFKVLVYPLVVALSLAGYTFTPPAIVSVSTPPTLGVALPSATAVFETSLASPITSSATTMTLTANAVRGGGALSGYACFTVDEGSAQAETICGTVSGTSVTGLTRGVSQATGTTTVSALQFSHRRGANVKITDFPILQIVKAQNNGEDTFPNILNYTTHPTFVSTTNLVDKKYVDDTAFSGAGVIDATASARGVSELATTLETASSTASGSSGILVIPATNATSTYNSATAGLRVVVTKNNGKIDDNFIATSSLFTNLSLATTTPIGAFPAWQIGKQQKLITTLATSSFAVPSGITNVHVRLVGASAQGGSVACSSNTQANGGAGAGGYSERFVDVTGTSSIQVYIGNYVGGGLPGQWTTFGTNGFYLSATGGSPGGNAVGGVGGVGSGGDINVNGQPGGTADGGAGVSGAGGSSFLGGGGAGTIANAAGNAGTGYGAGGSGSGCNSSNSTSGGVGTQGAILINW